MRTILDGLAPGLPADLAEAVLARADGIPLYAVETVRMLLHGGQLEVVDGAYRPVVGTIRLDVPETLHALIAARLDALDAVDRVLLQDAAVLGQDLPGGRPRGGRRPRPATLDGRLRALERREMISEELDPHSPERGQYAFVQALIREVAYATLSRPRPAGPAPGGGALLRESRRRRAGRRPRQPLPGRLPRGPRGRGGGRRSRSRHASPCAAPRNGRSSSTPTTRPTRISSRRSRSARRTPTTRTSSS